MRPLKSLVIMAFFFSTIGWIWQSPAVKKSKEAAKLYNKGKLDEALSKWRDAQIENPDKKELHYNIGGALHEQKRYDDSFKEYEKAINTKDDELKSKTYYNIGNTLYRMGELPEAIEGYEKCLQITPDDEDAKYNIEFIKKKMEEQKQEQETRDKGQEQEEQQRSGNEKEMSEEDAIRLLDAIKDDEQDLQKELRVQPIEGRYKVDKDW